VGGARPNGGVERRAGNARARKIIEGLGLQVAPSDETREILDLKGGDKLEV
jgi:hypothetical protein